MTLTRMTEAVERLNAELHPYTDKKMWVRYGGLDWEVCTEARKAEIGREIAATEARIARAIALGA